MADSGIRTRQFRLPIRSDTHEYGLINVLTALH